MKRKNGFTLVELLAVIVVLALIMIVVIPSIMKSIEVQERNRFICMLKACKVKQLLSILKI